MNSVELTLASSQNLRDSEEASFYLIAAQIRKKIDKQIYPPSGSAADSPGPLIGAISMQTAPNSLPQTMNNPEALGRTIARLQAWQPAHGPKYDPGWKYANPLESDKAAQVIAATKKEVIGKLNSQLTLLGNDEYRELALIVEQALVVEREYNMIANHPGGMKRVSPELKEKHRDATKRHAEAAKRMKEIEWELAPATRWHQRMNWVASDYFEDPAVIALCDAIADDDIKLMEQLISKGADANAIGRDNMTPLMWAFPDVKPERFACLLRHGADPNILFESDFNTQRKPFHPYPIGGQMFGDFGCQVGQSVTHLASRCRLKEYLELVLKHGGDPNLIDPKTGQAPLDIVIDRYRPECLMRVQWLIDAGADVNRYCKYEKAFPAMQAVQDNKYDVALLLLKSGADPLVYQPDDLRNLTHFVVRDEEYLPFSSPDRDRAYRELVDYLKAKDISLDDARQEAEQLRTMMRQAGSPGETAALYKRLIREREQKSSPPPSK